MTTEALTEYVDGRKRDLTGFVKTYLVSGGKWEEFFLFDHK